MKNSGTSSLKAFAYLNADKAVFYRLVMRVFIQAKNYFIIHLRPHEILETLTHTILSGETFDLPELEKALHQLCEWGNIEAHPDTADVATAEEFYRPRYLYQLTIRGEAAEQAVEIFEESLKKTGELQTEALGDIRVFLAELEQLIENKQPDEGKVYNNLKSLRSQFEELTSKAQTFIRSLQRTIDLQGIEIEAFLAYKEKLIGYLERFIGELIIATADIGDTVQRIEAKGIDILLSIAARRDLADAFNPGGEDYDSALQLWQGRWQGFKTWFIGTREIPSQAEVLRSRARSAIPALLTAVARINESRITRSDRPTDLRTLARWFAETDSDEQAHRLWRAAFALTPGRHLMVDADTLEQRDLDPGPPNESWLTARPLLISPRLRKTGRHNRPGQAGKVIDRSKEKRFLTDSNHEQAMQIAYAQKRLATGKSMRLSEIGTLTVEEFHLFLDLLGEALSKITFSNEVTEATSSDGSLIIRLSPTHDNRTAVVYTTWGRFSGKDYFISISPAYSENTAAYEKN